MVVNNAGIACISPAEPTPLDLWRQVIDVNLTGPFLISQAFGRIMLRQGSGSIVNIASVAGLRGVADRSAYNASKHGLVGLTRTLAVEWGGRGVRVNAVCPGWVKTPMDDASQGEGAYGDTDITDHVPLGRFATPDDVAQAVAFLASSRSVVRQRRHALGRRRLERRRILAVAAPGCPGANLTNRRHVADLEIPGRRRGGVAHVSAARVASVHQRNHRVDVVALNRIVGDAIGPPKPARLALVDDHESLAAAAVHADRPHHAAAGRGPIAGPDVEVLGPQTHRAAGCDSFHCRAARPMLRSCRR